MRLRRVMSRESPNVPMMRPSESRKGSFVVETHVSLPSGQTFFSS